MSTAADAHRLLVLSIQSADASRAVCVVRSLHGSAYLGTRYQLPLPAYGTVELTQIEWYGRPREVLDETHHGRVCLVGPGTDALRAEEALVLHEIKDLATPRSPSRPRGATVTASGPAASAPRRATTWSTAGEWPGSGDVWSVGFG